MRHELGDLPDADRELVRLAKAGDERALAELITRHHDAVYRLVFTLLRDVDRASDAAQETLMKAVRGLSGLRDGAGFKSWLLAIAANEAKGAFRKASRRRESPLEGAVPLADGAESPADRVARAEQAAIARAHLAALPEKQRLAVQLRIDEGMSFKEVGEVIGSSEGAARVNYHHGIRRLREMLKP